MKIDISRVNLLEKDIEDWLYENPEVFYGSSGIGSITRWFGRQYVLPSGIADLIGVLANNKLVVIEVKNVPINKAAILQVCRYAADLKEIAAHRMKYPDIDNWQEPHIEKMLVGPSIDAQTFMEADALDILVWQFSVSLRVDVSRLRWDKGKQREIDKQQEAIAFQPEWKIYGPHVTDVVNEDWERRLIELSAGKEDVDQTDSPSGQVAAERDEYDELMAAILRSPDESDDIPL